MPFPLADSVIFSTGGIVTALVVVLLVLLVIYFARRA